MKSLVRPTATIVLPALLVGLILSAALSRWAERTHNADLLEFAQTVSMGLDMRVESWRGALDALVLSQSFLREFDLATVRAEAARLAAREGGWAVLSSEDSPARYIFNTRLSHHAPPPDLAPIPEITRAARAAALGNEGQLSDVFIDPVSKRPTFAMLRQARAANGKMHSLSLAFEAGVLSDILRRMAPEKRRFIALVDGSGRVVARSRKAEDFELKPLAQRYASQIRQSAQGLAFGKGAPAPEGEQYALAHSRFASAPRWSVIVGRPAGLTPLSALQQSAPVAAVLVVALGLGWLEQRRRQAVRRQSELDQTRVRVEHERAAAAALESALARAQTAERMRDIMLARLGHDMRTPVLSALGALDLLPEEVRSHDLENRLGLARAGLGALLSLIDDVADLARLRTGAFNLKPAPFAITATLAEAMSLMQPIAETCGLRLEGDWPEQGPWLEGDEGRLRQILLNLLSNAVKYTPSGAVRLSAAWQRTEEGSWALTLRVSDTGVGIARDEQARMFEPFARLADEEPQDNASLGLGLSIVQELVDAMGGEITVDSTPGKGSAFEIRLTLPETAPPPEPAAAETPPRLDGCQLLLAEDMPLQAAVITAGLESLGVQVTQCATGPEALDHARAGNFDALLLDLGLPGMGGAEVARRWRVQDARAPCLALSADLTALTERDRAVFDDVLIKGMPLVEVARSIKGAIETSA